MSRPLGEAVSAGVVNSEKGCRSPKSYGKDQKTVPSLKGPAMSLAIGAETPVKDSSHEITLAAFSNRSLKCSVQPARC